MKEKTRNIKKGKILDAAERVFAVSGYKNSKMEDIATEAGITKVTLYSYFKSKENLYMALTHKALKHVIKIYEDCCEQNKDKSGLTGSIDLMSKYMSFTEEHPFYSELLLDYFELVRTTHNETEKENRLTQALQESKFFQKLEQIQNLPLKLALDEVKKGQADGSINPRFEPMLFTLQGWTMSLGYAKMCSSSGGDPIFNIELKDLKTNLLSSFRAFLSSGW